MHTKQHVNLGVSDITPWCAGPGIAINRCCSKCLPVPIHVVSLEGPCVPVAVRLCVPLVVEQDP